MENYVVYHLHTDLSNPNMVECVNNYKQYIDKAKSFGMKAIGFSEHGNILSWYNKKIYAEKNGIKYIHGVETYLTENIEEKKRDNYHCVLIAKNYEGFKELNKLISQASKRDGHFYYNARISFEDLFKTSSNIIVTSACLGGFIAGLIRDKKNTLLNKVVSWMIKNKDRCFLEIQPHFNEEQKELNRVLALLSEKTEIPLIAGTDTHALDEQSDKARKIMQKSKKIEFTYEDEFDLTFYDIDNLIDKFKKQDILTKSQIKNAINNTNVLADMVEEFELDYSKKYPKLYDNPRKEVLKKIAEGIKFRKINELPKEERKIYGDRIIHELEVYEENQALDYILLDDMVKTYARENDIRYGFGRGSVSGSLIAYLMQLTNIDPIKRKLSFARFMSKERVSLADIDTDYPKKDRPQLIKFLSEKLTINPVVTFNTIQTKGAIRDIGRGLDIPLNIVDQISKSVDTDAEYSWRKEYPKLFEYVDIVTGTVTSIGSHPCAVNVTDLDTESTIGTITIVDSKTKESISATVLNMKEIEAQNYVKLDLLILDTVEILSQTIDYVGLKWEDISPDYINDKDKNVWNSIKDNNVGIFQWESDFAQKVFKDLFSDKTIEKIKLKNPNFSYIDLFSLGNAILRPSGASYRDDVIAGNFYDNGNEVLNNFLSSTLGRLVYQENLIEFLVKFCGYTEGHSDLIRRGIGKKLPEIMDKEIPLIEKAFIETMTKKYGMNKEKVEKIAKPFIQVFIDATNYGFSINHSDSYSYLGYACAYLRHYYPLEFITASLNVNKNDEDRTNRFKEYAFKKNIKINQIKFGYSKAEYSFDKKTNSIYQGIESIKFMNKEIADDLFSIARSKAKPIDNFLDLLIYLKDRDIYTIKDSDYLINKDTIIDYLNSDEEFVKSTNKQIEILEKKDSIGNTRQLGILIDLDFFSEFGKSRKLKKCLELFDKKYKKTHKFKTKFQRYHMLKKEFDEIPDENIPLIDRIINQIEYLGYAYSKDKSISNKYHVIKTIDDKYDTVNMVLYNINKGEDIEVRIKKEIVSMLKLKEYDLVSVEKMKVQNKKKLVNKKWVNTEDTYNVIEQIFVVKREGA